MVGVYGFASENVDLTLIVMLLDLWVGTGSVVWVKFVKYYDLDHGAAAVVKGQDCALIDLFSFYNQAQYVDEADWMVVIEEYFLAWNFRQWSPFCHELAGVQRCFEDVLCCDFVFSRSNCPNMQEADKMQIRVDVLHASLFFSSLSALGRLEYSAGILDVFRPKKIEV